METAAVVRAFPLVSPSARGPHPLRARRREPASVASRAMSDVLALVSRFAPTDMTVTLTGETGTGKDVFAHLIHELSLRAGNPFVVFDRGAVPANLVERDLLGHARGAFTGAHAELPAAFERANGGTL